MVTFSNLGKFGRLGNQLFQIAVLIGYSKRFNYEFCLNNWLYSNFFTEYFTEINIQNQIKYEYFESQFLEIKDMGPNVDFLGYFQSEKYFANFKSDVKKILQPKKELIDDILKNKNLSIKDDDCFIHVRRGDYLNLGHFIGIDYYIVSIKKMKYENGVNRFFIFSDDIEWCEKNFNGTEFFFIKNQAEISDLLLMTVFKNAIIANSSFSWWGAYLGCEKNVICPLVPFKDWKNCDDYYPSVWYKI